MLDQSGVLGGAELSLLEIMKHLRESADVVLFDDGPFRAALDDAGVHVDVVGQRALAGVHKQGGVSLRAAGSLLALVREVARRARDADVIYANTQRAMVVGALAGRLARKPVVWHLRDIVSDAHFGPKQRLAIKQCARLGVTRVIANSDASARAFLELTGFERRAVQVVFNGISAEPFVALEPVRPAALRVRFGLPADAWIVGSFSRLAHWKGQHVLLEAARLYPDMHVALVGAPLFGEDEYAAELRGFVALHGLGERVHFLGFQRDVAACMKAVDVVAHVDHAGAVRPRDRRGDAREAARRRGARGRRRRDRRRRRERPALRARRRACACRRARRAAHRCGALRAARRERLRHRGEPVRHADLCRAGRAHSRRDRAAAVKPVRR